MQTCNSVTFYFMKKLIFWNWQEVDFAKTWLGRLMGQCVQLIGISHWKCFLQRDLFEMISFIHGNLILWGRLLIIIMVLWCSVWVAFNIQKSCSLNDYGCWLNLADYHVPQFLFHLIKVLILEPNWSLFMWLFRVFPLYKPAWPPFVEKIVESLEQGQINLLRGP